MSTQSSHPVRKILVPVLFVFLVVALGALAVSAAPFPAPYANGFEVAADATACPSTADNDTMFAVTRVASGTGGVTSAAGSFHATAPTTPAACAIFTRFGGYSSTFPANGFKTSIDIYLDMAVSDPAEDSRMDWSVAISDTGGNHRRDFVFSIGTNGTGGFVMSAGNNTPGWPANPGRDPFTITTTGWYTFQNVFRNNGGVLAVDMNVLDSGGTLLKSWTLSDATDIIGTTVGGNRYGWLVGNQFADLPIDNITRTGECTTVCYADVVNGDDANDGITAATAKKTIQAAVNSLTPGGEVRVLPGTYPESPVLNKSLTLVSTGGRDVTFIALQAGTNYAHSLLISGAEVTVDGFTIVGLDDNCPNGAATNIQLDLLPDNVVIKNNRFRVGAIGPCSTIDMGFGIITTYSGNPDVASLLVEDNIFDPLNTAGQRAYYINPSVVDYTFRGNVINGQFNGTAASEAQNNLIENNTINGTGTSRGFVLAGYVDPAVWGHGTIQGNTIKDTINGILIVDTQEVLVTKNILTDNDRGVAVLTIINPNFDESTIHINRNAITGSGTFGIENELDQTEYGDIDGTCNWWGAADGPGPVGTGTGDNVSADVAFSPWLKSDDLDGLCGVGRIIIIKDATPEDNTPFTFEENISDPLGDTFVLTDPDDNTKQFDDVQPGNYIVSEQVPDGWSLDDATCVEEGGEDNSFLTEGDAVNINLEDGETVTCTFFNEKEAPPPICPAESPYVGTAATTILGGGMFPNQTRTVLIKDPQQVVGLYAQLAGKKLPKSTYTSARFIPKLGTTNLATIDDNVVDSAEYRDYAAFWFGANLDAYVNKQPATQNADRVFGRLFVTPGSATNMGRALILYPDYAKPVEYFNYASIRQTDPAARLAISNKNFVYWQVSAGWFQTQTYEIELGGPLPAGWPLSVQTAVVDNDPDTRPFRVVIRLVDSNGVELARRSFQPTGPSNGQMLNINRPLFNVPAGTVKVILTLTSPRNTGDSVALVGVTANYPCAAPAR